MHFSEENAVVAMLCEQSKIFPFPNFVVRMLTELLRCANASEQMSDSFMLLPSFFGSLKCTKVTQIHHTTEYLTFDRAASS